MYQLIHFRVVMTVKYLHYAGAEQNYQLWGAQTIRTDFWARDQSETDRAL